MKGGTTVPARLRTPCHWLRLFLAALLIWQGFGPVVVRAGTLSAVSPNGASPGVSIKITGTGFNTTASNNEVTFTPSSGPAKTATPTAIAPVDASRDLRRLTVRVPATLPIGPAAIQVRNKVTGEISTGRSIEIVTISLPEISAAPRGATNLAVRIVGSPNARFAANNTRPSFGSGITVHSTVVESPTSLVATISIATSATLGLRTVTVVTTTQTLSKTGGFTVQAVAANRPPQITSEPITSATELQPYSYQVVANDPDNDPLTFELAQSVAGMTISPTGLVSWTPVSNQVGTHDIIVRVSDGKGGAANQPFQIAVQAAVALQSIAISPAAVRFSTLGAERVLTVTGFFSNDTTQDLTGSSTGTTYSSSNPFVATVSADGVVISLANGSTVITARNQGSSATATVTVEEGVTLQTLELTPADVTLHSAGATQQYTVLGHFSDGSTRDLTAASTGTTYRLSDESVAAISPDALLAAVRNGLTTLTAQHDSLTAHAQVRVAISTGTGFLKGEAYDDTTGLPLANAMATLLADGGGPLPTPTTTTTDEFGQFVLSGRAGDALVRISKPGFTGVDRRGSIPDATAVRLLDARLTPTDTRPNAMQSVFGGEARNTANTLTLTVQPGGVAADADIHLTPISAQGLAARLPFGWSPLAAAHVSPSGLRFTPAATLTFAAPLGMPAGTSVAVASYDEAQQQWIAANPAQVSADGSAITASLGSTSQVVLIAADDQPFTPPAPRPGEPLEGVSAAALPVGITATGTVVPRSAPPGPSARAVGTIELQSPTRLPSGVVVEGHVDEEFELFDHARVLPAPFSQDLVLYAHPPLGAAGVLSATFPVTPSRSFTIQELLLGKVRVDVTPPSAETGGIVIGANGGTATDAAGNILQVPNGALTTDSLVQLFSLTAGELLVAVPNGFELLAAVRVELIGTSLALPATLSIAKPPTLPTSAQVLVAQVLIDPTGGRHLRIVATAQPQGDRLVTQTALGTATLSGVSGAGQYLFLHASQALGFITGTIFGPGGATPQALALVTSDTAPFADLTGATGAYLIAGRPAVASTVAVLQLVSRDVATNATTLNAAGEVATLNITLGIVGPTVVSTNPAAGAVNIPLDSSIIITFSEPIDPATVSPGSVELRLAGASTPGQRILSADGRILTFRPDTVLQPNSSYTLVLTSDVRDLTGNALAAFAPRSFTTLDPSKPPQPAPGQIIAELPDEDGLVLVFGTPGTAEPGSAVTATNLRTQDTTTVVALDDGSFRIRMPALVGDEIALTLRDGSGRQLTVAITQFEDPDGTTAIGVDGGRFDGSNGRVGIVLRRALTAPGLFRLTDPLNPAARPQLPIGFTYVDSFDISVSDASFNRLTSLTLTESQNRFAPAVATGAPFQASGSFVVPPDFLVNGTLKFNATAEDVAGNRNTLAATSLVVTNNPNTAPLETAVATQFPTIFLSVPTQATPNQQVQVEAIAPAARVEFELTPSNPPQAGSLLLLVRVTPFGGETRLSVLDRLDVTQADGTTLLRTSGRELPGITGGGEYSVVASSIPLVFVSGEVTGPAATVTVDGLPFMFETTGPNAGFSVPVPAGQAFTLQFIDAATGASLGSASGQAPATGTVDLGSPLGPVVGTLSVTADPNAGSLVDIGKPIVFTFSEPVDGLTVTSATVVVTDTTGSRVFGGFDVASDGRAATFVPDRRWRYGTRYRYVVSTAVLARSGAALPRPFEGEFTTFTPRVLATTAVDNARDVAVAGNVALVGGAAGLNVVDVTRADAPSLLTQRAAAGGVSGVAIFQGAALTNRDGQSVTGTLGLAATGDRTTAGTLQILDLNAPAAPALLGSTQLTVPSGQAAPANVPNAPGVPSSVAIGSGPRGIVAVQDVGVETVDLAQAIPNDPQNPGRALGPRYPAGAFESANQAVVSADRLLVAGAAGLTLLDPAALTKLGSISTTGNAQGVAGLGAFKMDVNGDRVIDPATETFDLAVVANGQDGTVQFFNVTDPGSPALVSIVRLPGEATSVVLEATENVAYVGVGAQGLAIVDLAGPASLVPIDIDRNGTDDRVLALIDTPGVAGRLALNLARGVGYLADGPSGLTTLQLLPPRTTFETLLRDPVKAMSGDEEPILQSRRAFLSDDALVLTLNAALPASEQAVLAIEEVPENGERVLRFANGSTTAPLAEGPNSLTIDITKPSSTSRSQFTLSIRRVGGELLASLTGSLVTADPDASPLEALFVRPESPTLAADVASLQLSVAGLFQNGLFLNLTSAATGTSYASSNDRIATVDAEGLTSVQAGGVVLVGATNRGLTAMSRITSQRPAILTNLLAVEAGLTMRTIGERVPLRVFGRFSDGTTQEAAQIPGIVFTSSDASIVSVDPAGIVTAAGSGAATISVASADLRVDIIVNVEPRTPASIASISVLAPTNAALDDDRISVGATVEGTGSLDGLPVRFVFSGVAAGQIEVLTTVSGTAAGVVTPSSAGNVTVTASVVDPASGQTRTATTSFAIGAASSDNEPNGTVAAAAPFRADRTVTGSVGGSDAGDTYQLDLPLPGTVTLSLSLIDAAAAATLTVVVRDAAGVEIARLPVGALASQQLALPGNAVFISLESSGSSAGYSMTMDFDQGPVGITSVAPLSGGPGTLVTIDGSGFSPVLTENIVTFGGAPGKVVSATATRLQVRVPAAGVNGAIEVVTRNRQASGPQFLTGRSGPLPNPFVSDPADGVVRELPGSGVLINVNRFIITADPVASDDEVRAAAARHGGDIVGIIPQFGMYVLEFPGTTTLDQHALLRRVLSQEPTLGRVSPSFVHQLDSLLQLDIRDSSVNANSVAAYRQVRLTEAVEVIRRNAAFTNRADLKSVRVAVLDDGFVPTNFDKEFKATNTNGLRSALVFRRQPANAPFSSFVSAFPGDHGSAVAGIIAAVNNKTVVNGVLNGVVDASEDPYVVDVYKVLDRHDNIVDEVVFVALAHIKSTGGADVINMSFGTNFPGGGGELLACEASYEAAIQPLAARTFFTLAAGNDNVNGRDHCPASIAIAHASAASIGAVAVLNTDNSGETADARARFGGTGKTARFGNQPCGAPDEPRGSNCGISVTLAAPGEDILTASTNALGYENFGGTSGAAPMVAGVAALLQTIRPTTATITPDRIKQILFETADDISATWSPGPMRRLNAEAAVRRILPTVDNQKVLVTDRDAQTPSGVTGAIVGLEADPLNGQVSNVGASVVVPAAPDATGLQVQGFRPSTILGNPDGSAFYVYVETDAPYGDGILVINSTNYNPELLIPLAATGEPKLEATVNRPPMVLSKDGRLLYVGVGDNLRVVNTRSLRLVENWTDLPDPYKSQATNFLPFSIQLNQLQNHLGLAFGSPAPAFDVASLDISADGRTLLVLVRRALSGPGDQPGAVVPIDIDLYRDADPSTPQLDSDLSKYLELADSQVRRICPDTQGYQVPATSCGGDEPSDIAASRDGRLYMIDGGARAYISGIAQDLGVPESIIQDPLFGLALETQEEPRVTILNFAGKTSIFQISPFLDGNERADFGSFVTEKWQPSAASGGSTINQFTFPAIYTARPTSMTIKPDGQRALVSFYHTGNFGVLDLTAQQNFPGGATPNEFAGFVAATPSLRLDAQLWPRRGVFRDASSGRLVQSPDEALLFTAQVEYAQNGRFAIAAHRGAGLPEEFDATLPAFTTKLRLALNGLGFSVAPDATCGSSPEGQTVCEGGTLHVRRGGGAITVINDDAISGDFSERLTATPGGRPYYATFPLCGTKDPTDALTRPACLTNVFSTLFDYLPTSGAATQFAFPVGVAIQPFVVFDAPHFGDVVRPQTPVRVTWRDQRAAKFEIYLLDDTPGAVASASPALSGPLQALEKTQHTWSRLFKTIAAGSPLNLTDQQRVRLRLDLLAQDGRLISTAEVRAVFRQ